MSVPSVVAGQSLEVLHQKHDGTWESLPVVEVTNGYVTATFTSFSPVAIIAKNAAPKTGEMIPFAGILMVMSLAGAVVCTKKLGSKA